MSITLYHYTDPCIFCQYPGADFVPKEEFEDKWEVKAYTWVACFKCACYHDLEGINPRSGLEQKQFDVGRPLMWRLEGAADRLVATMKEAA